MKRPQRGSYNILHLALWAGEVAVTGAVLVAGSILQAEHAHQVQVPRRVHVLQHAEAFVYSA